MKQVDINFHVYIRMTTFTKHNGDMVMVVFEVSILYDPYLTSKYGCFGGTP